MSERLRRVDEAVKEVLSESIGELKDPRIGFVTVTGVRTSPDLRHARVFVSVLGSERKRERSLEGLAAAHGVLQARLVRGRMGRWAWATSASSRSISTSPRRAR